jgi:F0F1-type ATP synthase alpha subunit
VGQERFTITQLDGQLDKKGAMDSRIIVAASASNFIPLQFHATIFYNNLSKQAVAYSWMSFLLRRLFKRYQRSSSQPPCCPPLPSSCGSSSL